METLMLAPFFPKAFEEEKARKAAALERARRLGPKGVFRVGG